MIRLVIGYSPGSLSDRIARAVAPLLTDALAEEVLVHPQPGDDGMHAARSVAGAAPDGRTLFVATLGTHALARWTRADAGYDPATSYAAVGGLACAPLLLACHPRVAAADVAELIEQARTRPGVLSYGTSAMGGAPHLAAALFEQRTGVVLRHVCYAQTRVLYRDLEAGRLALTFNNVVSLLPRCRAGAVRALAVTAGARLCIAPEVSTLAESGVRDYEVTNWTGLVAPRGTPRAVCGRLNDALQRVLRNDALDAAWRAEGLTAMVMTPERFSGHLRSEMTRWRTVATRLSAPAEHRPTEEDA